MDIEEGYLKVSHDLLLHETPIIKAIFKRIYCLLRGGHKYQLIETVHSSDLKDGMYYIFYYSCDHCHHLKWKEVH